MIVYAWLIPADHFHDNGDGTASFVKHTPGHVNDRPCDTCGGKGEHHTDLMTQEWGTCPDCHGRKRHTFEIKVAVSTTLHPHLGSDSLTVHIIDVAPLIDVPDTGYPHPKPDRFAYISKAGSLRIVDSAAQTDTYIGPPPSAAEVGDHVVRVAIHES